MKKYLLSAFILVLVIAPRAWSQFEGSITMKISTYSEADTSRIAYTMAVKNDMIAISATGGPAQMEGGNFIIRGDKRLMWIINDQGKNYVEFPLIGIRDRHDRNERHHRRPPLPL